MEIKRITSSTLAMILTIMLGAVILASIAIYAADSFDQRDCKRFGKDTGFRTKMYEGMCWSQNPSDGRWYNEHDVWRIDLHTMPPSYKYGFR